MAHQSKLPPAENKFHKGNGDDGKHYWLTPPDVFAGLQMEFDFDFDPCPHPLPDDFDGLTQPWGVSNYVNPPFGSILHEGKKKGPTAWVRKAIAENRAGKTVVLVYPVDKWLLMLLGAGAEVRNLGDVKWLAVEDGTPGKGTGRHIAAFILRGDRGDVAPPQGYERDDAMLGRILTEINEKGFLLNNLFQLGPNEWRANVRRRDRPRTPGELGNWQHDYCDAPTAEAALLAVVAKLGGPQPDGVKADAVVEWERARLELTKALRSMAE